MQHFIYIFTISSKLFLVSKYLIKYHSTKLDRYVNICNVLVWVILANQYYLLFQGKLQTFCSHCNTGTTIIFANRTINSGHLKLSSKELPNFVTDNKPIARSNKGGSNTVFCFDCLLSVHMAQIKGYKNNNCQQN